MKLALISPKSSFLGRNREFREFLQSSPEMDFYRQYWTGLGLGLLVVAALTPEDFEIDLVDENTEDIDFGRRYDLVGITAMTQQATRAYEIADRFRLLGVRVVLGGIHPTVMPEEAQAHADSVVVGEVENLWRQVLEDCARDSLQPLYSTRVPVDVKQSPVPRYELSESTKCRVVWVQSSRGCPHDCRFCCASRVYGSSYRQMSIRQVLDAVGRIRRVHPRAMLGFADDSLFTNRRYARQLLEELTDLKVRWIGQSDISIARHHDLLRLAKASGCVALFIGFESIDEANLRGLDSHDWKLRQRSHYEESIDTIQSHGIGVFGTFMVGFDNDDTSTFERLTRFIQDNHLAGAQIAALTPFPHTRLREELMREGRVLDTPWENYTLYDANITPKRMSALELEQGVLASFKKVYSEDEALVKARYFKAVFSRLRSHAEPRL